MQIMPPIQEIEVQRGHPTTFSLDIRNIGDTDTPSRFVAYDMDINSWGSPIIADTTRIDSTMLDSLALDTLELKMLWTRGCGSWITLEPAEIEVKTNQAVKVTGTITAPMDAEGSYYALIKGFFVGTEFETDIGAEDEGQVFKVESQAAVVVMVTVKSSKNRAIIYPDTLLLYPDGAIDSSLQSPSMFTPEQNKAWKMIIPMKNDGNVHTQVSGSVSFWTESGMKLSTAELTAGKGYVFPGRIRNFEATGTEPLADGYYMLRVNLQSTLGMNATREFPFAVYERKVYPGALTDELTDLLRTAKPSFTLLQSFMSKDISPGGSAYLAIQMQNITEDTIKLVPRVLDWTMDENSLIDYINNGEVPHHRSFTSWINMEDKEFLIPPGRKNNFKIKVNAPLDAAGEYYAAIAFDLDSTRLDLNEEFLRSRTQLMALKTTKNAEYNVVVDSMEVEVLRNEENQMTLHRFTFTVHNNGNVHLATHGNLSLDRQELGGIYKPAEKMKEFGSLGDNILPNGKKSYTIEYLNLEPGKYRTVVVLNYAKDQDALVKYQTYEIN